MAPSISILRTPFSCSHSRNSCLDSAVSIRMAPSSRNCSRKNSLVAIVLPDTMGRPEPSLALRIASRVAAGKVPSNQ